VVALGIEPGTSESVRTYLLLIIIAYETVVWAAKINTNNNELETCGNKDKKKKS
jgi:hypothetical protein